MVDLNLVGGMAAAACSTAVGCCSSFRCPFGRRRPTPSASSVAGVDRSRTSIGTVGLSSTGRLPSSRLVPRIASPVARMAEAAAEAAEEEYVGSEDYLVKKVTAKEVQELLKGERSVPVVIDFYATWCGPCILMAQHLETLAVEYEDNALFLKVDTDEEYQFARDMQVFPTLYFISPDPSKDAIRTEGLLPPETIKNVIDDQL